MEYHNMVCDYCNLCAGLNVNYKKGMSLGSVYAEALTTARAH